MSPSWFGTRAASEPHPAGGHVAGWRPNAELRIDREAHPGWSTGAERTPVVGDAVVCSAGTGEVTAVRGKTGDGSRLLEIRLDAPSAPPFFAAASNVLLAPPGTRPPAPPPEPVEEEEAPAQWLG